MATHPDTHMDCKLHMHTRFAFQRSVTSLSAIFLAGLLAACGGGGGGGAGGGSDAGGSKPLNTSELQGRWASSTPSTTLIVIVSANGGGTEGWRLASDGQSLEFWTLTASGSHGVSAKAKRYTLGEDSDPVLQSHDGTASLTSPAALTLGALTFSRSSLLDTSVDLSSLAGQWTATAGGGAITQNLTVASNGDITGSTTAGCAYSGHLSSRAGVGVLDMRVTEVCGTAPAQTTKSFAGIASYAATTTPARLTLVGTSTPAPDRALVIAAQKTGN
jgi:hypothetical protein